MDIAGFEDRMDQLADQGRTSRHTRNTYVNAVRRFREWRGTDEGDPTADEVQQYLEELADGGASDSSVQTVFYAIKRYFKFEDREHILNDVGDYISENHPVGSGSTPDYLEDEQIKELKQVAKEDNPRDAAIVYLLASTGCRVGELVALDLEDVDLSAGEVRIERQKRNETIHDMLPLSSEDVAVLDNYRERRDEYGPADETEAFFVTRTGRMSSDTVQRRLTKLAEATESIDPDEIHPHLLRHWVGTKLAEQGKSAQQIADYLGHASVNTSQKYIHLSSAHREEMRDALEV